MIMGSRLRKKTCWLWKDADDQPQPLCVVEWFLGWPYQWHFLTAPQTVYNFSATRYRTSWLRRTLACDSCRWALTCRISLGDWERRLPWGSGHGFWDLDFGYWISGGMLVRYVHDMTRGLDEAEMQQFCDMTTGVPWPLAST